MHHRWQCLLISTLLLLAAGLAVAATAGVPKAIVAAKTLPAAPDDGPCWSRLNDAPAGYPSVQAAVDASARPTDVVKVAGYCAGVQQRAGFTQTVYLSKTLTLQGGYTVTNWTDPDPIAHPTTLDAQRQGRALLITGGAAPTLAGLRLTGGDAAQAGADPYGQGNGGGLYVLSAAADIRDCLFYDNVADRGGGVFTYDSHLTMRDSTLTGNVAPFFGGGILMVEGTGRLEDTVVFSNTAGMGAGAYLASELVTLTNNAFLSNTAQYEGGGLIVEIYGGHSELVGNYVAGNRAYLNGGGLYFGEEVRARTGLPPLVHAGGTGPGERLLFAGNVIAHNWTPGHGGGVYMGGDGGAADLVGNMVWDNTAGGDGGGIYLDHSADPTPILSNTVTANVAGGNGGGIYLGTTTATVRGNVVQGNLAGGDGGGGYGRGIWSDNTFSGNRAVGRGGGLGVAGGGVLTANLITSNEAGCGGGLALVQSSAAVQSNVIAANEAGSGGGLCLEDHSDAVLVNNWIVANRAFYDGSGLLVTDSRPRLAHNTIARNAGYNGLYVRSYTEYTSAVVLTDTILVSHTVGLIAEAGNSARLEATLWGNETDWAGAGAVYTGMVNIRGDPAFADPDAGDYHIGPGSAAVDSGITAGVTTDIDGDPRPMGAGYDIGADELLPGPALVVSKQATPDPVQMGSPLTYALHVTNTGTVSLTATITDVLPLHVTPGGSLVWTPPPLLPGEAWTETVAVTVELGYTGPLTNVVRVSSEEGATGATTNTVAVTDAPVADLVATNDSPTALGSPTTLTATITAGSHVTYSWAFGDETTGSGAVVTHTYPGAGVYTAVVIASNPVSALTATTTVTITRPGWFVYLPLVVRTGD